MANFHAVTASPRATDDCYERGRKKGHVHRLGRPDTSLYREDRPGGVLVVCFIRLLPRSGAGNGCQVRLRVMR